MEQHDEEEHEEQLPALRSIHNRQKSFVRFINRTRQRVRVYWIDYQGNWVSYKILACGDHFDVNTFVTHPWIFVNEETKDRYLGNGQEVFFPEPWFNKYRGVPTSDLPSRVERVPVYITQPMFSLRDLCLREIKRRLIYDSYAYNLEIPWSLQRELYVMHPRKNVERSERDIILES